MFKLFKNKVNINQLAKAIVIKAKDISVKGWILPPYYPANEDFIINKDIKISIHAIIKSEEQPFSYTNYFRLFMHVWVKDVECAVFQLDDVLKGDWSKAWINGLDFSFDKTGKNIRHELTDEWIDVINEWSEKICDEFDVQFAENELEKHNKYLEESKKIYSK